MRFINLRTSEVMDGLGVSVRIDLIGALFSWEGSDPICIIRHERITAGFE